MKLLDNSKQNDQKNLGTAKQPLRCESKEVHYILCNEVNIYSKFDYYVTTFSKKFLVERAKKHCNILPGDTVILLRDFKRTLL